MTTQKLYISLIKRPIGFLGALAALLLLSPLFLCTMLLLAIANKGAGIFFTQDRPGKNERVFKLIKFKSMTDEKDINGNLLPEEQRLTKVGSLIRKFSIDELPQLINILKGDMAFIGPRPLLPKYLPLYSAEQHRRHEVRPGMSGWAQVHGRNNISWTDKFKLDVWYVDHCSIKVDFEVFFRTIKNVFSSKDIVLTTGPFTGNN